MSSCRVCGANATSTQGATDPSGAFVCASCIEQARRVIMARRAAQARTAYEEKTRAVLEQAEQDNSWLLDLRTDEALAAAAHQCRSCGRFLEIDRAGCMQCGYGLEGQRRPAGMARSGLGRLLSLSRDSSWAIGSASTLLPGVPAPLVTWLPRLAALAPAAALIAGERSIAWRTTGVLMLVGVSIAALALLCAGAFVSSRRAGGLIAGAGLGVGVCGWMFAHAQGEHWARWAWLAGAIVAALPLLWLTFQATTDKLAARMAKASLIGWGMMLGLALWRVAQLHASP